ncbi:MAG TPA: hypothetical protein VF892_07730, partial [Pseudonocardiaceae bacterium]
SWTGTANMKPLNSFGNATTDFEGAGLFSDAASTLSDATTAKGWTDGAAEMDLVGDGMDAIGVAMDPFGSLLGAGIGWLIEHIGFLKKPLDYLAGDPEEITAKQQTWENIAKALNDAAAQYKQSASAMAGANQGTAVSGVNATANNFSQVLTGAAGHASDAAEAMKVAGVVVGTTRGVIRDSLSQFAGDAIVKWIAATAAAFFTFGATEAAFVVDEVAEGTSLAVQDASKVSKVLQFLEKLKGSAKDSSSALDKAGDSIAKDAGKDVAGTGGKDAAETAGKDAGKTAPNDTGGDAATTTSSASGDTPTAHADDGSTRPAETNQTPDTTAPQSTAGGEPHVSDQGTAPKDTSGPSDSTSPASSDPGGTPSQPSDPGGTAPKSTDESATTPSETPTDPSASTTPSASASPKEPSLEQKVDAHKEALDDHNATVAKHNEDAANFRQQSAEHNQKAIENEQKMAENNHARDMNQQAMNRARAQGKPHEDLKAQHRELEAQHKQLKNEDTRLSHEQKDLEQRHQELNKNAADINANAKHLHEQQSKLKSDMGKEWTEKHSLANEDVMDNKFGKALRWYDEHLGDGAPGLHNLGTYEPSKMLDPANWKPSNLLHHGIPGVPAPSLADARITAEESGKQWFSEQAAREDNIAAEYNEKLDEQHAWPTAEQSG